MKNAQEDRYMTATKNIVPRILWSASRLVLANADLKLEGCGMSVECQWITVYTKTTNYD